MSKQPNEYGANPHAAHGPSASTPDQLGQYPQYRQYPPNPTSPPSPNGPQSTVHHGYPGVAPGYGPQPTRFSTRLSSFNLYQAALIVVAATGIINLFTILFALSAYRMLAIICLSGVAGVLAVIVFMFNKHIDEIFIVALSIVAALGSLFAFIKMDDSSWSNVFGLVVLLAIIQGIASIFLLVDTEKKIGDIAAKFSPQPTSGPPIIVTPPNPFSLSQPFPQNSPQQVYVPEVQYGKRTAPSQGVKFTQSSGYEDQQVAHPGSRVTGQQPVFDHSEPSQASAEISVTEQLNRSSIKPTLGQT